MYYINPSYEDIYIWLQIFILSYVTLIKHIRSFLYFINIYEENEEMKKSLKEREKIKNYEI